MPFGAFVRVEEGIEGLVHISELAERHVEVPDQVVGVNDDAMVKVIDIDLERRRISLEPQTGQRGLPGRVRPVEVRHGRQLRRCGQLHLPEGFDSETNEWLEGFDKQRAEWEARYAEAERRHKMHTTQMEKFAAADAAAAAEGPIDGVTTSPVASLRGVCRRFACQRRPVGRAAREARRQRLTR